MAVEGSAMTGEKGPSRNWKEYNEGSSRGGEILLDSMWRACRAGKRSLRR